MKTNEGSKYQSVELTEKTLSEADVVILTTNHSAFDVEYIQKHSSLIVDMRNMIEEASDKIYKL